MQSSCSFPADLKKILELDPSNSQAQRSIRRLEPLAAEKREKMKEEMIGKSRIGYLDSSIIYSYTNEKLHILFQLYNSIVYVKTKLYLDMLIAWSFIQ